MRAGSAGSSIRYVVNCCGERREAAVEPDSARRAPGKVAAAIALLRALRDEDGPTIDDALDRILGGRAMTTGLGVKRAFNHVAYSRSPAASIEVIASALSG